MSDTDTLRGMNVVLFITDQERSIQHFPSGWARANMPGHRFLMEHGLTFPRAFCNACMCSPSRATLFTGFFPAQHRVKWTLEDNMNDPLLYPQHVLATEFPNLGTVMQSVGYSTPYRGKFHLTKPAMPNCYRPSDVNQYGFEGWDCPDAGANQNTHQFGGGYADHDERYMEGTGPVEYGQEGVLQYLRTQRPGMPPFFLTVSLVNPHDVLAYPNTAYYYGYTPAWVRGDIGLPVSCHEDLRLNHKPHVQNQFLEMTNSPNGLGPLRPEQMVKYVNFYGNLIQA